MYLTKLFADKAPIRYTYYQRGTALPFHPNATGECSDGPWFNSETGKLFRGESVVYAAYPMMDGGFDLAIDLGTRYFVDHITLKLVGGSDTAGIDVLDGEGRLVARAPAEATATGREFTLSPGVFAKRLTLRFHATYSHIGIAAIEIYAAADMEDTVYPLPTRASYGDGVLPFGGVTGISADKQAEGAADYLAERLGDELSVKIPRTGGEGSIRLAYAEREDDGYTLSVGKDGILITAAATRAFFYAAATLLQLATDEGFRYAEIDDSPMMALRGVHVALPMRENLPFLYRLVRELLVPMRYNMVILQLSGAMEYKCFPKINEAWQTACRKYEAGEWPQPAHYGSMGHDIITHEEIRALCAYIRSFGLEIVPEIQSFSHSQYITTAFPHLAEVPPTASESTADIDQKLADVPSNAFYPRDLCPRHPEYYDYIFKIIDEVIEVIRPEHYLHMGHDEVYEIGSCPRCQGHATEVFIEEVTRLHDYLAERGLTMMIWSDMLQEGEPYMVPDARAHLPRDIIMLDFTWYFELPVDIEDRLLPHGYRLMIGNMYSSHYPRYETRAKKEGIIGAQVSTWAACHESSYAYRGKMFDFVYTANMMWSADYDPCYRLTYTELVTPLLMGMRRRIGLLPKGEATHSHATGGKVKNIPRELLFHSPVKAALRLSPERSEATVGMSEHTELIEILHATDRTSLRPIWEEAITIGDYTLLYADGSSYTVPIRYSESILTYRHRYGTPIPSVYYRHYGYAGTYLSYPVRGKDSEGRDYTLYRFPIKNPHPERELIGIRCRHAGNTDAEILIFDVKTT